MTSRLWLNLALFLFVVILISIVVFEPGKEPPAMLPRLTQLTSAEITHIHIKRATGKDIELVKETNGQWWMHNPYYLPANEFRVQSLLRLAETESLSNHNLADLQPASYGLNQPRAIVTFNRNTQIRFGDTEPLQQRRYVQIGDQLHTIVDTFYYQAAANPTIYLNHALLPPSANINKLVLPKLQLLLKNGQWQRNPPYPDYSADASIELINNWRYAQALELRPSEVKDGKADIEVYLTEQSEPIRFKLLQTEDEVILLRLGLGLQYVIAKDLYAKLSTLAEPDSEAANQTASQQEQ
jgi:hypothetical protein